MSQLVNHSTGEIMEVPEGREFSERELLAMLVGLYEIKRQERDAKRAYEKGAKPVRDWLDAHPGETLRDGETGIEGRLQPRQGSPDLDVMRLAEANPDLLRWAAVRGILRLDLAAFRALDGKAREMVEIGDFMAPGAGSEALVIQRDPT